MGKLTGSAGRAEPYIGQVEVSSLRLDDFCYRDGNPRPSLIKLDIEGGGVKAIPGMLRLLTECRPLCFIELHGPEEGRAIWTVLKQNGYTICRMQKGYPEIEEMTTLEWKEHVVALP